MSIGYGTNRPNTGAERPPNAPAGLYKPDVAQNAQDAGLRELREETSLDATVVCESIEAYSSGGCLSETIKAIIVNAKPKDDDQVKFEHGIVTGPTKFDTGEDIITLYVPVDGLYKQFKSLQEDDHAIDARLMTFAFSSYVSNMAL
ncbi:hypothetical protein LX32DRAFT_699964 [Colletotrichum zoysiae]|uniref:Nudix hydrolase domain-containing protein n=1 Tax=Colletotrichum zoysiae TaxID=1216348 RepID=A0AAD9H1Y3_9PEZI|nr:hypothetical protein LX32DRAFT_699964 [Colletotrichum zoysiae]